MASSDHPLKATVLSIWFLGLLLWLLVAIAILTVDQGAEGWFLGFSAFIVSFTGMVLYLTFWWRDSARRLAYRFLRASLLTTGLYGLLLFGYVLGRIMIDGVGINDPFIDVLLPWITFLRLAIAAFLMSLLSFLAYLAFFWGSDQRPSVSRRVE